MGNFLILLGAVCLGYYAACIRYAGVRVSMLWIWLVLGIAALGAGAGMETGVLSKVIRSIPRIIWWCAGGLAAAGICTAGIFTGLVISAMREKGEKGMDVIVVLGCQVKGRVPSRALSDRLEAAKTYMDSNPETVAVLSGSRGFGEEISEADCMISWLSQHGIASERLIPERRSTNTAENLEFSRRILEEKAGGKSLRVGIVTSNFHMYRSLRIAAKKGYCPVWGIAAPGRSVLLPHYILREAAAIPKDMIFGNI